MTGLELRILLLEVGLPKRDVDEEKEEDVVDQGKKLVGDVGRLLLNPRDLPFLLPPDLVLLLSTWSTSNLTRF